ncbi:MAG: hypothetical protein AB3N13_01160 [Arenibacterium sp.]
MTESGQLEERIAAMHQQMRAKLKVRGRDFPTVLSKSSRRLPKTVRKAALQLADAIPLARHPKLAATLDHEALARAARVVEAHLESIDLAEQRKSWWLGVLGSIAFNMLLIIAALVVFAIWYSRE